MNPAIFAGVVAGLLAASRAGKQTREATATSSFHALMIWFLLGPMWLLCLLLMVEALARRDLADALGSGVPLAVMTVLLFPWPITRLWLIPRGHPRAAWLLSSLSFWVWSGDVRGGALIAAAWAAARRAQRLGQASAADQDWIEAKLDNYPSGAARWKLGGGRIVAAALLAEAKGDRAQARRLFVSASELAAAARPTRAIVIAWEWLCAEAISDGHWRVAELVARSSPVESRNLAWFSVVAARLTGIAPVPNDLVLQSRWMFAPQRIANWPLLRRAMAAPTTPRKVDARSVEVEPPPLPEGPALTVALTLHAHTLARDPARLTRVEIATLARAWDLALADPQIEELLEQRGEALGAHASARSQLSLRDTVREDLLMLIQASGLELGKLVDDSEILARAAKRLHADLIDALEITTGALRSRVDCKRELPALQEWQTFLALREQYSEAVSLGGLVLRRLAFSTVHGPLCSLAVWLWNDRSERAIANAMFSWLLSEAIIVDDAEAIRLQEKNVGCGV